MKEKGNNIWRSAQRRLDQEHRWGREKSINSTVQQAWIRFLLRQALCQGTWHKENGKARSLTLGVKDRKKQSL